MTSRASPGRTQRSRLASPVKAQFKASRLAIETVIASLVQKFVPREITEADKAARRIIAKEVREYMSGLDHSMSSNEMGVLEDRVQSRMWQTFVDPLQQTLSGKKAMKSTGTLFTNTFARPGTASSARLLASQSLGLNTSASSPGLGLASATAPASPIRVGDSQPEEDEEAARKLLYTAPSMALQLYYQIQQEEQAKQLRETIKHKDLTLQAFQLEQARERREAQKREEEENVRFAKLEIAKGLEIEERNKREAEEVRENRLREFKEREVVLKQVLAAKAKKKAMELQAQDAEIRKAQEEVKLQREAAEVAKKREREALVTSLNAEAKRLAAIRAAAKGEAMTDVDPEVVEAERLKLIKRSDEEVQRRVEKVHRVQHKQQVAAQATLRFKAAEEAKLAKEAQLIEEQSAKQVAEWQAELKRRADKRAQADADRLATVMRQIDEVHAKREQEARETAEYSQFIADGARAEEQRRAMSREAAKRKKAEVSAKLEAEKRERDAAKAAKEASILNKLDEQAIETLKEIESNPEMLHRIKDTLDSTMRAAAALKKH